MNYLKVLHACDKLNFRWEDPKTHFCWRWNYVSALSPRAAGQTSFCWLRNYVSAISLRAAGQTTSADVGTTFMLYHLRLRVKHHSGDVGTLYVLYHLGLWGKHPLFLYTQLLNIALSRAPMFCREGVFNRLTLWQTTSLHFKIYTFVNYVLKFH